VWGSESESVWGSESESESAWGSESASG